MSFANSTTLTLTPSYAHHFSATSTPLNTTATTTAITISTPPPLTPPPPPPPSPSLTTTASNAAISGIKISNMTAVTSFITNTNSSNSSQFGVNLAEATTATPWLNPAYNDLAFNASTAYDASYFEACDPDNPHFNCSREKYLEFEHGPQRLPLQKALMVTIIFGGIFITGVLGNVLVCVVIVRHSMMHTATNYYLFSLALSDLLYLLFGLPAEVFHYWHQYPYLFGLPFCKIRAFISEASSYVSVLTILAFSMERFLAICHPLHLYAMSGFKRALRIIAGLWILSFMTAIPFGLMTDIVYLHYPKDNSRIHESAYCSIAHIPENLPVFELSFCIFFVIPMVLIMVLYGGMGAKIRSRTIQQLGVQQGSMHRESRHQQSKRAIIRMLAAVVITFFICWLPFHLQRLWFLYGQNHENFDEINEWMFSFTGFTYYVSCTINPILYNVMSLRYRLAFKEILCGQRRNTHHNNGFVKDQSSFRETTLASSLGGGGNTNTERPQSFRVRTMRHVNITRKSESLRSTSGLVWSRKTDCSMPLKQNAAGDSLLHSTVVVVDKSVNGRSKVCCTENVLHENLINKSNETCI